MRPTALLRASVPIRRVHSVCELGERSTVIWLYFALKIFRTLLFCTVLISYAPQHTKLFNMNFFQYEHFLIRALLSRYTHL